MNTPHEQLETQISERLAMDDPEVELLACELVGSDRLRIIVDHPDGVSLEICERVSRHLKDLLETLSVEVSSPGPERPLSHPEHYRRYVGRRARVRTRSDHGGRKSFSGELVAATDDEVTVAADGALFSIPYNDIKRSNLLPELPGPAPVRKRSHNN